MRGREKIQKRILLRTRRLEQEALTRRIGRGRRAFGMERKRERESNFLSFFFPFFLRFGERRNWLPFLAVLRGLFGRMQGRGGEVEWPRFLFFPSCTRHSGGSERGRLLPRGRWIKEEYEKGARKEGGKERKFMSGRGHAPQPRSRAVRELGTGPRAFVSVFGRDNPVPRRP